MAALSPLPAIAWLGIEFRGALLHLRQCVALDRDAAAGWHAPAIATVYLWPVVELGISVPTIL
ncbi:hypothetical protein MJ579_14580 [Klebsiella pneumoniae]|nr:hypothetical protein MJ579_14580 [Klebsiella pneumoniae]